MILAKFMSVTSSHSIVSTGQETLHRPLRIMQPTVEGFTHGIHSGAQPNFDAVFADEDHRLYAVIDGIGEEAASRLMSVGFVQKLKEKVHSFDTTRVSFSEFVHSAVSELIFDIKMSYQGPKLPSGGIVFAIVHITPHGLIQCIQCGDIEVKLIDSRNGRVMDGILLKENGLNKATLRRQISTDQTNLVSSFVSLNAFGFNEYCWMVDRDSVDPVRIVMMSDGVAEQVCVNILKSEAEESVELLSLREFSGLDQYGYMERLMAHFKLKSQCAQLIHWFSDILAKYGEVSIKVAVQNSDPAFGNRVIQNHVKTVYSEFARKDLAYEYRSPQLIDFFQKMDGFLRDIKDGITFTDDIRVEFLTMIDTHFSTLFADQLDMISVLRDSLILFKEDIGECVSLFYGLPAYAELESFKSSMANFKVLLREIVMMSRFKWDDQSLLVISDFPKVSGDVKSLDQMVRIMRDLYFRHTNVANIRGINLVLHGLFLPPLLSKETVETIQGLYSTNTRLWELILDSFDTRNRFQFMMLMFEALLKFNQPVVNLRALTRSNKWDCPDVVSRFNEYFLEGEALIWLYLQFSATDLGQRWTHRFWEALKEFENRRVSQGDFPVTTRCCRPRFEIPHRLDFNRDVDSQETFISLLMGYFQYGVLNGSMTLRYDRVPTRSSEAISIDWVLMPIVETWIRARLSDGALSE